MNTIHQDRSLIENAPASPLAPKPAKIIEGATAAGVSTEIAERDVLEAARNLMLVTTIAHSRVLAALGLPRNARL